VSVNQNHAGIQQNQAGIQRIDGNVNQILQILQPQPQQGAQ